MKQTLWVLMALLLCVALFTGCGGSSNTSESTTDAMESEQAEPTEGAVEPEPEETDDVDDYLAEASRIVEEMEPKKAKIESRILEIVPAEYQASRWFDVDANIYDTDAFSIMITIDIATDDEDLAKSLSVELHRALIPLEEELEFRGEGYFISVVNDGSSLGTISNTDDPNEYAHIHSGGLELFTVE